jgi:hypothetical protein
VRCDLVLLIDQFEELFAASVSEAERDAFIDLMAALVGTGRVWIAVTLRSDFYPRMLTQPALRHLKQLGATCDLAPPGPAELAEIVRSPAAAAGLAFESDALTGERLDTRLLRDADRPDMLPLVQLALSRLFEGREIAGDQIILPLKVYESLGGLKGIVNEAGEKALAALSQEEKARLPRLLRQLAVPAQEPDGTEKGALTTRAVTLSQVAPETDAAAARLVAALTNARLLSTTGSAGDAQVRLVHQRVLEDWSRARTIVAENTDFYHTRAILETQLRRCSAATSVRQRQQLLLRDPDLANGLHLLKQWGPELPADLRTFIIESGSAAKAAARRRWAIAGAIMLMLAGLTAVSAFGFYAANTARHAAVRATAKFDVVRAAVESPKSGYGESEITAQLLSQLDRLVDVDIAPKTILWFDPHPEHNASEVLAFEKMGFRIEQASSITEALAQTGKNLGLIITQYGYQPGGAQPSSYVLKHALDESGKSAAPIIIYSTGVTTAFACAAQKRGFYDETDKPAELFELVLQAARGIAARSRCIGRAEN